MGYRLSITFARLGHSAELPDRLLTVLLEAMPDAGPVIDQNIRSGELTVLLAFESARPTDELGRLKGELDSALARAGVQYEPVVLDVHVAAVGEVEGTVAAPAETLQTA
jgi:hypothetical protein